MKILITGAAGFIGSHLVESLAKENNQILSLVRPKSDISFITGKKTDIVYGDIVDLELLKKVIKGIDIVYHLAAIPNWKINVSRQEYEAVNIKGTRNVLEACRLNRVGRILFISSLEAVGPSADGSPVDELTEPRPGNIYGESKLQAEMIVKEYYKKYGLAVITARLPMVYGPRNLLHLKRYFQMVKSGYYPVVGDGAALMEFCYVKNAVFGLRLVIEKGKPGETYFLSDERSYRFREVITEIASCLEVDLKVLRMPIFAAKSLGTCVEILSKIFKFYPFTVKETGRPAFSRNTVSWMAKKGLFCDISKAKKDLGYKPGYTLREGIKETAGYYKQMGLL